MMRNSFSWEGFDPSFLRSIIMATDEVSNKERYRKTDDKDVLVSRVNRICTAPDYKFIKRYRSIIENEVLSLYKEPVKNICRALNMPIGKDHDRLVRLSERRFTQSLAEAYCAALYEISGLSLEPEDYSSYRHTKSLNMRETKIEDVPLYDFQEDAVQALKKHFIDEDRTAGMLVMPTGSGKSRTSTCFLIREMVSRGYQVVWLVHRHMLIDQAADCFYRYAGLSKIVNPQIKTYRLTCISGVHSRMSVADKDEVIVASISSVCRNMAHLSRILKRKVMVVVDEAHRTFAPSYRKVIGYIRKHRKDVKLLGITATPIRANDEDSKTLLALYDNTIIYDISMSELIKRRILADPKFITIETNEDFEPQISYDEGKLIDRYGELPESLVNKIALSKARNACIVSQYLDHRDDYGKTLIFAMNILHGRLLAEDLRLKGVKCGFIYSGNADNAMIIKDYRSGKFDVLINVAILTEGSDIPEIQTVFLTRPTQSEGLLMQMIGRGMRGPKADKGTETVNIVDFHDKWTVFQRWLNPEWVIDKEPKPVPISTEAAARKQRVYREIEWRVCCGIYNSMRAEYEKEGQQIMLPVGWFSLCDEDGEDVCMLFFENQVHGLVSMLKDNTYWLCNKKVTAEMVLRKYFTGFGDRPTEYNIRLLMDNYRNNDFPPQRYLLKNRKSVDPVCVAEKIRANNTDLESEAVRIYNSNETARDLFPSEEVYVSKVREAYDNFGKTIIIGQSIEEVPLEWIPFDRNPEYDIDLLAQEVIDEMFGGSFEGIPYYQWTDKAYKGFYGRHFHDTHAIEINSVLNSKDVDKKYIKYLLYHEMLHRDHPKHDAEFRRLEHLFPDWEQCDHFLDSTMNRFDIKEW